jgi:preprotein translocase subunit YajC
VAGPLFVRGGYLTEWPRREEVVAAMALFSLPRNLFLMAQAGGTDLLRGIGPLILIMGIFYVLMIVPHQRRQKKIQQMLGALKNGDKVIAAGGIYGTIVGIEGDSIQLRIADQVKIKVLRSAVSGLQPESKEDS